MTSTKPDFNPAEPEIIEVTDLDQFVRLLGKWHERGVKNLEHFLKMPEGIEVEVDGNESKVLSGDLHEGFLLGLHFSLMQLGTLPFGVEVDSAEAPATEDGKG